MSDSQSQIAALRRELKETSRQASELWDKQPPENLLRRPSERKWSPAQCVEHLNITYEAYVFRIDEALHELEAKKVGGSARMMMNFNAKFAEVVVGAAVAAKVANGPRF
jgi:hypothetical protein